MSRVGIRSARGGQAGQRLAPGGGLGRDDAEQLQLVPEVGLEAADPERGRPGFLQGPGLLDQPAELVQLGPVEAK